MSAAATFHFDWPFGGDLYVAYAMIMSTAGEFDFPKKDISYHVSLVEIQQELDQ